MIKDEESVVRILRKDWFVNGKLLHVAFALRRGETYISVNRPAIEKFNSDVADFVAQHPDFVFSEASYSYYAAKLNAGDIRDIKVGLGDRTANIEVEVEPRGEHVKSHAGIFTRYEGRNLKSDGAIQIMQENVSADDILLKVRQKLLQMPVVEYSIVR